MNDTYVLATRRLPRRRGRRVMAWDTDRPYHYARWTDDGRLLLGGEDTRHRSSKGSRRRIAKARERLTAYLARIYPELADESRRVCLGRAVRGDARRPSIHRGALTVPQPFVCPGLWRKRDDRVVSGRLDTGGFVSDGATSLAKRSKPPICLPLTAGEGNLAPHFQSRQPSAGGPMKEKLRNFYVGVTIAAVIAVLAIAQYTLQTVAQRAGEREHESSRHLRSRPHVAEAASEQLGARIDGWSRHRRARSCVHRPSRPVVARPEICEPDGVCPAAPRGGGGGRAAAPPQAAASRRRVPETRSPGTVPAT